MALGLEDDGTEKTPTARNPWFGIEIEIFVRVRDDVKKTIKERIKNKKKVWDIWKKWQWDLENVKGDQDKKEKQRKYVGKVITAIFDQTLGEKHGWTCVPDASLKEYYLTEPRDPRKWWGIEIVSPPLSAGSEWQTALEQVFTNLTLYFDVWTNDFCACHVHVSVGPGKKAAYNLDQLIQIAKGAFFWESAFRELLPVERRENRYALANWRCFATGEYLNVGQAGWAPVWSRINNAVKRDSEVNSGSKSKKTEPETIRFAKKMTTAEGDPSQAPNPRYRSTSFSPYEKLNTTENRRQAGVASAKTAIRRVLLALTLNVASLDFDFEKAGQEMGKRHPTAAELIPILFETQIKKLPKTCHGAAFKTWLGDCKRNYANDDTERMFDEKAINEREQNYHLYGQATNPNSTSRPSSVASNTRPAASGSTTNLPTRPAPAPAPSSSTTRNVIVTETQQPRAGYVPQNVSYSQGYGLEDANYGGPARGTGEYYYSM
ncbi:putative amidoligase enzyme-domain-containing protein [Chaetomium sp. MPI-CAGE-AT-0009]|nr:putative amidoligase enzyme-domain-containing protein [Chaetomium sp. MPI-CAGE-AT-0009]